MRERAPYVDVVLGTHNVHRAAELVGRGAHRTGPITEILDAAVLDDHAMFPSAPAGAAGDVVQRLGHDPDRLRQPLRVLHRAGGARRARSAGRSTTIVAEVDAARRRRRHRGHPARPERQQLRARPAARRPARRRRPARAAAAVRRAARRASAPSTASAGCASPARTPRTCAPRRSRRWPRTPAVCEHLHYPLQSGSDRVLAAMHRGYTAERYLERLAAGPRAPSPTSR